MEQSPSYARHDLWHVANYGRVWDGGALWCVEDGGGVCGQSSISQACFHPASIEMDNLALTRRSSTYVPCAHVHPICRWWCMVEDGGGVCGESSQACFHAASVDMDNLTLIRRRSTYEPCAHVHPICTPRLPTPMARLPKNTMTNSTINAKHNHHKHASAEDAPRQTLRGSSHRRCHAFKTSI